MPPACPQSLVSLGDSVWLLHGTAAPLQQQENGSPHTCVGTRHPRPTLFQQICRRRNLLLHIKFGGELNKAGDLHILYIPLASRQSLHPLPGIGGEDSGRLSALLSHRWQERLENPIKRFPLGLQESQDFRCGFIASNFLSGWLGLLSPPSTVQSRAGKGPGGRNARGGRTAGEITPSPAQTAA